MHCVLLLPSLCILASTKIYVKHVDRIYTLYIAKGNVERKEKSEKKCEQKFLLARDAFQPLVQRAGVQENGVLSMRGSTPRVVRSWI